MKLKRRKVLSLLVGCCYIPMLIMLIQSHRLYADVPSLLYLLVDISDNLSF